VIRALIVATLAATTTVAIPVGSAAQQSEPPAPGPLRPYQVPALESAMLPNGLNVVVVRQASLPIVTSRIIVDAGTMWERARESGLAQLTGQMLREGTRTMTGPQLAERMERLGASFGVQASFSQAMAMVTGLKTIFPDAFALAAEAVTEPTFPEADFTRLQRLAVAGFEQQMSSAEGVASRVWQLSLYDPSSPFSRPSSGTAQSLLGLTRDDVVRWHRQNYAPSTTTVLFVGDITLAEARALVERTMGSWQNTVPARPTVEPRVRPTTTSRVILVDRPGSVQSAIYVGAPGIGAADPDFIPLTALQHVLGGGFGSRANMNLRERHGFTYGAFTTFTTLRGTGWLAISSSVRSDATDSALVEALGEYRRIVSDEVPRDELRRQLDNLVSSFPSSVQTVQGLAQRVMNIILYGLPSDYFATYRERLAGLTAADIQRVGRQHLHPDAATIVVVGDLSKIEEPIRARNFGAVEVWDRDGNRVR
jgi:zinc protease